MEAAKTGLDLGARRASRPLSSDLEAARNQLTIAFRLGAPRWRVAFNRGLLAEAEGDHDEAAKLYRMTVRDEPDYRPARARLRGIESAFGD